MNPAPNEKIENKVLLDAIKSEAEQVYTQRSKSRVEAVQELS